jgi:hypothetical protein
MGVQVKGIQQAIAGLNSLVNDINTRKIVRAMQSALIIGGSQAALYTPIDTSTLINSQFRDIEFRGTRLTGRIGYSANYAVYVHDPKIRQTFRRSTAQKEFLKKGFEDTKKSIDSAVMKELSL